MKKSEYLHVCQKCQALCCKLGGTNLTKEEVDRILNKGFENHFIKIKEEIYELKSNNDGTCPYLNKDFSCKIQEVKPMICTCWPIFPEFEDGKINHVQINCPLTKNMKKEEIEKCKSESLCVPLEVAEASADESLISLKQLEVIKKIYGIIEKEESE